MKQLIKYFLIIFVINLEVIADVTKKEVKVGILSRTSNIVKEEKFASLIGLVNKNLKNYKVSLYYLDDIEMLKAITSNSLDIILTNPGHYIAYKNHYILSNALATLARKVDGENVSTLGGVIVTLKERDDIKTLKDLKGKKIAIPSKHYFAGYKAPLYELFKVGVKERNIDFIELGSHKKAILELLNGRSDAAFIRTGILEDMEKENILSKEIKVLNAQPFGMYPYKVSTALYPEWSFFALPHVEDIMLSELLGAIFTISYKNETYELNFVPPKDYISVEELYKSMRFHPYDKVEIITYMDVIKKYTFEITIITLLFVFLILILLITLWVLKKVKKVKLEYQQIFQYSPNAVVIYDIYNNGKDFIFADINERVEEIEKVKKDDILGKKVTDIFPSIKNYEIFNAFVKVWKTGKSMQVPLFLYEDDQRYGYRLNTVSKLPSGQLLVIYSDETEFKYSQNMLNTTMQTIKSIVLTTSGGQELEWCNDHTLYLLGYKSIDDLKKKYICICKLFQEDIENEYIGEKVGDLSWIEYALANNQNNVKVKIPTVNGMKIFSLRANYLDFDEKKRFLVIMDDITKLEHSIESLKEKTKALEKSNIQLQESYESVMKTFVTILEEKDVYTAGHSKRVANYSVEIAKRLNINMNEIDILEKAGQLHDIGKIITPESILLKPDRFNSNEYALMQQHAETGSEILGKLHNYEEIARVVRYHHERYDGNGYPDKLKGEDIPLLSRIMTVADSFDAMTTNRVYKPRLDIPEAVKEIKKCSGTHFDPKIVSVASEFFSSISQIDSSPSIPVDEISRHRFAYFFKDNLTHTYNGNYLDTFLINNKNDLHFHSACLFNLHGLHNYNKTHGWNAGNEILIKISNDIVELCKTDMVFRLQGDKFVVLYQDNERANEISIPHYSDDIFITVNCIDELILNIPNSDELLQKLQKYDK